MRKKRNALRPDAPTARGYFGQPDDCSDLVNRYGTYNIQPTADTENPFPAIAQGLPRSLASEAKHEAEQVRKTYGAAQKPEAD